MPTSDELRMLQALPLELKIRRTEQRIREWVDYWGKDRVCVSFSGGKDSTVLLHIVRKMYGDEIPAVFVNTGLEYPEIQRHVRSFPNVVILTPEMNFRDVLTEYGYPVISKETSKCIEATRAWCSKFLNVERERERERQSRDETRQSELSRCLDSAHIAAVNQERGTAYLQKMFGVGFAKPKLVKGNIPDKSRYSSEKYVPLLDADFLISDKCCAVMKKTPLHDYQQETGRMPFVGTMADESLLRKSQWLKSGCNSFNGKASSKPMSFGTEQDVLRYILDNDLKIAPIYGEIVPDGEHEQIHMLHNYTGRLLCTGAQRTGCVYCPFGAGRERLSEEGRFIRLFRTHPRQYEYVMNGGAYDPEDGYWKPTKEGLGFAHVFDEINRLIPTKTGRPFIRYRPEGDEMELARKLAKLKGEKIRTWADTKGEKDGSIETQDDCGVRGTEGQA